MRIELFKIEDGDIIVNRPIVLTIPEFNIILRRSKGIEGDSDGRKKLMAFKEFAYIYHIADPDSKPNRSGYNENKAIKYAKDKAGLPDNWKADDIINKAINIYKNECVSVIDESILELIKTFSNTRIITKKVRKSIETILSNDLLTVDEAKEVINLVNILITQAERMPELSIMLQNTINKLKIENKVSKGDVFRGSNEEIPDSANPDKDY